MDFLFEIQKFMLQTEESQRLLLKKSFEGENIKIKFMLPIKYINISDLILKPGDLLGYSFHYNSKPALLASKIVIDACGREVLVYCLNSRKRFLWDYYLLIEKKGFYIRNSEIYMLEFFKKEFETYLSSSNLPLFFKNPYFNEAIIDNEKDKG